MGWGWLREDWDPWVPFEGVVERGKGWCPFGSYGPYVWYGEVVLGEDWCPVSLWSLAAVEGGY